MKRPGPRDLLASCDGDTSEQNHLFSRQLRLDNNYLNLQCQLLRQPQELFGQGRGRDFASSAISSTMGAAGIAPATYRNA
jgi:hypothetical protein